MWRVLHWRDCAKLETRVYEHIDIARNSEPVRHVRLNPTHGFQRKTLFVVKCFLLSERSSTYFS